MSGLNDTEMEAWRGFLRTHLVLVSKLDSDMQERHGLPLVRYAALVELQEAGGPLRMHEFADRLLLSRSATSRFVDRLERDGLVERRLCAEDRRGMEVELTARGHEQLAAAAHTHLEGVRRYFLRHLTPEHLEAMTDAFGAVLDGED